MQGAEDQVGEKDQALEGYPEFTAPVRGTTSGQDNTYSAIWGGGQPRHTGHLHRVEVTNIGKGRVTIGPAGAPGTRTAKAEADLAPEGSQVWTVPNGQQFLAKNSGSVETNLRVRVDRTYATGPSLATWRKEEGNTGSASFTLPPQGLLDAWIVATVGGTFTVTDPDGPLLLWTGATVANTPLQLPPLGGDLVIAWTTGGGPGAVALLGKVATL